MSIVIVGDHPNAHQLVVQLEERGAQIALLTNKVTVTSPPISEENKNSGFEEPPFSTMGRETSEATARLRDAQLIVLWTKGTSSFAEHEVRELRTGSWIIDAGIGAISADVLDASHQQGLKPVRVNIWPALAASLLAAHESSRICETALGWEKLADIQIVAGGALGRQGDVVVDSAHEPTRVIGVADGRGGVGFRYSESDAERVRRVSDAIQHRLITLPAKNSVAK